MSYIWFHDSGWFLPLSLKLDTTCIRKRNGEFSLCDAVTLHATSTINLRRKWFTDGNSLLTENMTYHKRKFDVITPQPIRINHTKLRCTFEKAFGATFKRIISWFIFHICLWEYPEFSKKWRDYCGYYPPFLFLVSIEILFWY